MPPRVIKAHHIHVKSHKLSILLSGFPPATSIGELKAETLSALKSDVAPDALDVMAMEPPEIDVETEQDFELCRAVKDKGKPTGAFEVLNAASTIRDAGLSAWEVLFLQFRDRATGDLLPITYTLPPLYDEGDEPPQPQVSSPNKGKRKAPPEDEERM
ncbi:hypothetical protein M413DRAFT_449873 [Hebeloma cylindrosporum]|uniref:Uncharacterized protein n=1 Tax=Hebeloma cylindrosporum TaxID=76867 RepID=A0A0C3BSY1_HEBCY|nr:hypothetical protein M413DRAFT_449873 [Hebeloma cylindrosporum h7]